jgi:hypothetical protein
MTKKEAIARKAAWSAALKEGRVVNFVGMRLTSYPTVERAQAALTDAHKNCIKAHIVTVPMAN